MKTNLTNAKPGDRLQLYCRFPGSDEATPMHNGAMIVIGVAQFELEACVASTGTRVKPTIIRFRRSTGREPGTLYCAKPA